MRRVGWGVSTCVCEYSRGEGWGWRCVGHSLETHTHTHIRSGRAMNPSAQTSQVYCVIILNRRVHLLIIWII